jgi:hypothetical protein
MWFLRAIRSCDTGPASLLSVERRCTADCITRKNPSPWPRLYRRPLSGKHTDHYTTEATCCFTSCSEVASWSLLSVCHTLCEPRWSVLHRECDLFTKAGHNEGGPYDLYDAFKKGYSRVTSVKRKWKRNSFVSGHFKSWHVSGRMFSITSKVAEKRQGGFCYIEFRCRWPSKTTRDIKSHIRTHVSLMSVVYSFDSKYISNYFDMRCILVAQIIFRIVLKRLVFVWLKVCFELFWYALYSVPQSSPCKRGNVFSGFIQFLR